MWGKPRKLIVLRFMGGVVLLIALFACSMAGNNESQPAERVGATPGWSATIQQELQALGAGNWVVVADAGFPVYSGRGRRTLLLQDEDLPKVLNEVVVLLDEMPQVEPRFRVTRELWSMRDDELVGVGLFRGRVNQALSGYTPQAMGAHSLNRLIEQEQSVFSVLVIKTKTQIPYSAVYIQLENGYWDRASESRLRQRLDRKNNS